MGRDRYAPGRMSPAQRAAQQQAAGSSTSSTPASSTSSKPASSSTSSTPASSSTSSTPAGSSAPTIPDDVAQSGSSTRLTDQAESVLRISMLEGMGEAVLKAAIQGVIDGVAMMYAFDDEDIGGILLQLAADYDVSGE